MLSQKELYYYNVLAVGSVSLIWDFLQRKFAYTTKKKLEKIFCASKTTKI